VTSGELAAECEIFSERACWDLSGPARPGRLHRVCGGRTTRYAPSVTIGRGRGK